MKKGLISFILLIMIFCVDVSAFEVNPGGVGIDAGGNTPVYDIRYSVSYIYLDVTSVDGDKYTLSFKLKDVDTTPNSKAINVYISRELIEEKLQNEFNVDGKSIIDPILNHQGGEIKSRAKIAIFNQQKIRDGGTFSEAILDVFDQEKDVEDVARKIFGFSDTPPNKNCKSDLQNMRDLFNLNIFNMSPPPPPPPPPPPSPPHSTSKHHMTFVAELKEIVDKNANRENFQAYQNAADYKIKNDKSFLVSENGIGTNKNDPLKIKAGYGIPISAELQGFEYTPDYCCCDQSKPYMDTFLITSFNVGISTSFNDDGFWTRGTQTVLEKFFPWGNIRGVDTARMAAHINDLSPIYKRKIYTKPTQPDGLYWIRLDATTNVLFDERVLDEPCDCCCKTKDDCYCCCKPPPYREYDNSYICKDSVTLWVKIIGSMFEDDGSVIYE